MGYPKHSLVNRTPCAADAVIFAGDAVLDFGFWRWGSLNYHRFRQDDLCRADLRLRDGAARQGQ